MVDSSLVTGAAGFVGSNLVRQLLARGDHVKAFVRPGSNLRALRDLPADRLKIAVGDARVEPSVYAALAGCSKLYHVAAHFRLWDPKPEKILAPTLEATRATLGAAQKRGIEKIVLTSSVGALGVAADQTPMDESHAFNLEDPELYFRAKHEVDLLVDDLVSQGMPIVRVLPGTIAGPGDWKPTPNGRIVLDYLNTPPTSHFPVAGGGINVVDVEDVAQGHMLAMDRGVLGERYILGGDNLTFPQVFETLCDLTGLAEPSAPKSRATMRIAASVFELVARLGGGEPRITTRLARDYVDAYSWVTSAKAERELGYTHRPARDALLRSVRWFLGNGFVAQRVANRVRLELRPA
ncbi:MAG TPA: NAD-dependent epimerase/dehydratase family protein [Polyangiaceae bacterium]|jgi:dihydroflavonol-4-reductase